MCMRVPIFFWFLQSFREWRHNNILGDHSLPSWGKCFTQDFTEKNVELDKLFENDKTFSTFILSYIFIITGTYDNML